MPDVTPPPSPASQHQSDMQSVKTLADAVTKAIGENKEGGKRFIDVNKIALICLSISHIHSNIEEIKEMMKETHGKFVSSEAFVPVRNIVYGLAGLMLTSVIIALLTLVLRQ